MLTDTLKKDPDYIYIEVIINDYQSQKFFFNFRI